jgi:GNAT superfamily N-acetyltransferase
MHDMFRNVMLGAGASSAPIQAASCLAAGPAAADSDSFSVELHALSLAHPDVSFDLDEDDGYVNLNYVEAKTAGEGLGTAFMNDLVALTDKHGMDIIVDPAPTGGTRLRRFYERFGFVEWHDCLMMRVPASRN